MSRLSTITSDMTIAQLQAYIRDMLVERGFKGQALSRTFLGLVEEVGELAEVIKNLEKSNRDKGKDFDLSGEIADVLIYILDIACECDIDVAKALEQKESENRLRDWNVKN